MATITSPIVPGAISAVTRPIFPSSSSVTGVPSVASIVYATAFRRRSYRPFAITLALDAEPPPAASTRTVGVAFRFGPSGTIWNSITFTPEAESGVVTLNGAHTRSVQNDAIQDFGKPDARSVTLVPGAPDTTRRYFRVLAIEPGKSAPVHGASDTAVFAAAPGAMSKATVASWDSSKYIA